MAIGRPRGGARSRRSGTGRREPRGGAEIAEKGESRKHQYYRQVKMLTHHGSALSASPRCNIRLPDLAGNGNGTFESLTVSIRGRVPTRLRRVARWRQRIAAKHTPVRVPGRTAKPFERATRRSRVGTGVGAMRPGCRQSDEKAPSPFPGKPLKTRPRPGSPRLHQRAVGAAVPDAGDRTFRAGLVIM